MRRYIFPVLLLAAGAVAVVWAQSPRPAEPPKTTGPKQYGTLNFESTVGSFKVLGANEEPAEGTLDLTFNGTVLISGLDGTVQTTGSLVKEYDNAARKKTVYFGRGRIVVKGKYKAVQFFGKNLRGTHNGWGIFRFYGEFDRNLNTGFAWFDPAEKLPWGTGGFTLANPLPPSQQRIQPRVRPGG
jgi:hypothetical protein